MRIRWKMLILLVTISLVPLVTAAMIGRISGRRMGDELTEATGRLLTDNAYRELNRIVELAVSGLERDRAMVETAVDIQARAVESLLAGAIPGGQVHFSEEFDSPDLWPAGMELSERHAKYNLQDGVFEPMEVSYETPVIRLLPGAAHDVIAGDIARLASLGEVYDFIHQRHSDLILWQYTTLDSGVHSSYPGHGGYPEDYDSRNRSWYTLAKAQGSALWSPPIIDASTRQVLMVRSSPIFAPDGDFAGVTGIDVPMTLILQRMELPEAWRDNAKVALTIANRDDVTDDVQLQVIAQQDYNRAERIWDMPIDLEVLRSDDATTFAALIDDVRKGEASVRRMPYLDRDCLWACGPIQQQQHANTPVQGLSLLIIVPFESIMAGARQAEDQMARRLNQQFQFTGLLLIIVIVIVVVIAFLASRAISRPVRDLALTARRISEGDLEARATVSTSDELGELARAFNQMLPQLQDRLRLRESLNLAMEVQQHLLPQNPPQIKGIDVAGRSVYCDETGGDYYDFLHFSELTPGTPGTIGLVIGDVTGHGIAAALLMTTARALLHIRAPQTGDIAQVIGDINRHLAKDTTAGKFMTFFYLLIDAQEKSARWISAGHDPAILYDPDTGEFSELEGKDLPLGVDENWTFREESRADFKAGQVIVLGTDGIWEARNEANEMYGKEPLQNVIREHAAQSAKQIADAVIDDLVRFRGGQPQLDDVTLIVLRFTE
ncbi:MAG: SpoIIE family protein phosphatase [Planctomycetes bacterium]|nr:SpoIIE family protein phosphatase [Planctomycetota bacterium]